MKPDARFRNQPEDFWANVRTISEEVGYTEKRTKRIKVPTLQEASAALGNLGLKTQHLADGDRPTRLGSDLVGYFEHRAGVLNKLVRPHLMDVDRARKLFERLRKRLKPQCPIPMNKQKGKKKAPAYLTGIVNMLVEANKGTLPCDYDPRQLTTITRDGVPLRTLSRRVDGAFPSPVNPTAIWEIKEYYYTTTFGSRVADGVYESLLDGMELAELREHEDIYVRHYLVIDAKYTWWDCGKSYLCRIVDMLHMGYVDEVLFGHEVVGRLPELVKEWVEITRDRGG